MNNTKRMESLKLMQTLQPFTQMGILRAEQAKALVDGYKQGNTKPLKELVYDPGLPVAVQPLCDQLQMYIQ